MRANVQNGVKVGQEAHVSETLSEHAAQALEWPRLLEILALHAQSGMGAAQCRSIFLSSELADARLRQQETTEMVSLLEGSDPMPALAFPDIREQLTRSRKGGALEAGELRDCAVVLALMAEVERYAESHAVESQALARVLAPLHEAKSMRGILKAVEEAIQSDGFMKDTASPELRRLTHQAQGLKREMRQHLEQLLHSQRYEDLLQ